MSSSDAAAKKLPVVTSKVGFARDIHITSKFMFISPIIFFVLGTDIISSAGIAWSRHRSRSLSLS
jgi:hypothetical protein